MRLTKFALAAVLGATLASQAVAGGFAPVVVESEPTVVLEPTAPRSTLGILLPLALLGGLVALAVAAEDDDETTPGNDDDNGE